MVKERGMRYVIGDRRRVQFESCRVWGYEWALKQVPDPSIELSLPGDTRDLVLFVIETSGYEREWVPHRRLWRQEPGLQHLYCCSAAKSYLTLLPHGLQQARLPCLSLSSAVCSDSCPLSWWCHPNISSSVIPFSCLQSFPASGSFPLSWLFASRGQSIGASISAPVLPMNSQGCFPLGLTGTPCCPRDSLESSPAPQFKSIKSASKHLTCKNVRVGL